MAREKMIEPLIDPCKVNNCKEDPNRDCVLDGICPRKIEDQARREEREKVAEWLVNKRKEIKGLLNQQVDTMPNDKQSLYVLQGKLNILQDVIDALKYPQQQSLKGE